MRARIYSRPIGDREKFLEYLGKAATRFFLAFHFCCLKGNPYPQGFGEIFILLEFNAHIFLLSLTQAISLRYAGSLILE
jgi:hypothetical protein